MPLGPRSYEIGVVTRRTDLFGAFAREAARPDLGRAVLPDGVDRDRLASGGSWPAGRVPRLPCPALGSSRRPRSLPAGESTKSLACAARLYDELVRRKADRHTLIVALGGGVIGDLAGFVAATYARGLPLIMVPTTLLAQVDSSVGGKVGINHPDAKNIIGAFHQPVGVWIDTETLRTLPVRELRCGLAEVVKYGVILDAEFFATWSGSPTTS